MKVLAADILAKIPDLPSNFEELVRLGEKGMADVRSFKTTALLDGGEPEWYPVHIEPHRDDPGNKSVLNVTCPCMARTLCHHVVAFYAVAKKDDPQVAPLLPQARERPIEATPPAGEGRKAGLGKIAESQRLRAQADELLTDGIALIVRAESKEA